MSKSRFPISFSFVANRIGTFLLTVVIAATLIWVIPRMSSVDPAEAMLGRMASGAGFVENSDQILSDLRERYGLNEPMLQQYFSYLRNLVVFDFGVSVASFPTPVSQLIAGALPWTLGLMIVSIILSFVIGNAAGAYLAWEETPRLWKVAIPAAMIFTSIPPILSGLLLMWLFSTQLQWLPLSGSYGLNATPGLNWEFIFSVIEHGTLPVLSIVIVSFGFWALGMRGLLATVQGQDYVRLASTKGLKPRYILYRYMVRNAILPQVTALSLKIGLMVSGQILVESIFSYNGMGKLLYDAILDQDFPVIQGISFVVILMTAISVLIVDLLYPLIDPRIRLEGGRS